MVDLAICFSGSMDGVMIVYLASIWFRVFLEPSDSDGIVPGLPMVLDYYSKFCSEDSLGLALFLSY